MNRTLSTSRGLVVFTDSSDGDVRADATRRLHLSRELGLSSDWCVVEQVHGAAVVRAGVGGHLGVGDAMFTTQTDVPLAVFTADCLGVVLRAAGAVGVAHAGWRGTQAGVVSRLRTAMEAAGHAPNDAFIGPHIRDCCFEVGPEVAERFPAHTTSTSWGTPSVNLAAVVREQLDGLDVTDFEVCTHHETGWFSHRRDADPRRMATLVVRRGN